MGLDMASQVLSGISNPSYTNTTGQNVRLIINFMQNPFSITWAGITQVSTFYGNEVVKTYDANLVYYRSYRWFYRYWYYPYTYYYYYYYYGFYYGYWYYYDYYAYYPYWSTYWGWHQVPTTSVSELPSEIMLAPNQSFSAVCGAYNILAITELAT
jgi:hypothetical protein